MFANVPTAEIHLNHIRANFELARSRAPGCLVMPVIKANGYGHGAVEVAEALGAAEAFAVARVAEGVQLRAHLETKQSTKPIVVLEGFLGAKELEACLEQSLFPMVHSDHQLELLPDDLPFWLKFNTGMFRLGFAPTRAAEISQKIPHHVLLGICSHFANADEPGHALNRVQAESFQSVCKEFPEAPRCFANSGGILSELASGCDWIRPGVMLFGGAPAGEPLPELKAGMTLKAPVISVQQLSEGDCVGYGSSWQAKEACRIAVVALGYADGYPREMPEGCPVLVNGERRKLVGRVSMDMCTVLLDDSDEVSACDSVTFWGPDLPIDEIATRAGTISYTLMTGLGGRVQRQYSK